MRDIHRLEQQYQNDPIFYQLVESLVNIIETLKLSPDEIREAAFYAVFRIQMNRTETIFIPTERPKK